MQQRVENPAATILVVDDNEANRALAQASVITPAAGWVSRSASSLSRRTVDEFGLRMLHLAPSFA